MKLLLAPHFDDESLFAAFICLRENPLVLFCFDGAPRHGSFETRWDEAQRATRMLGCEALALRESYDTLVDRLSVFDPEHVWAPLVELGGNADHNFVSDAAEWLWPGRVSVYSTYTEHAGRTVVSGAEVTPEPGWEAAKRSALACYQSQSSNPQTRPRFGRGLEAYALLPTGAVC